MASTRLINVSIGKANIAIETVPVPGSELTFGPKAKNNAASAFSSAHEAILEVAQWTAGMIAEAAASGARPDQVELEFGLRFSPGGGVILAAASDQSSLHVTLTYGGASQSAAPPVAAVAEVGIASAEAV